MPCPPTRQRMIESAAALLDESTAYAARHVERLLETVSAAREPITTIDAAVRGRAERSIAPLDDVGRELRDLLAARLKVAPA